MLKFTICIAVMLVKPLTSEVEDIVSLKDDTPIRIEMFIDRINLITLIGFGNIFYCSLLMMW